MKRTIASLSLLFCACDLEAGESTLRFNAWGEDFIEQEIPADAFVDGWSVDFETFEVTLGGVDADGQPLEGEFMVDLAQPSDGAGHALGELVVPAIGTPLVSWTLLDMHAVGSATRDGVTKTFDWRFDGPARYVECDTGTPLSDAETTDVVLTVHADHLFYDDLDAEDPGVAFDLIAEADADDDGVVTMDELGRQSLAGQVRYQVGGRDIDDLRSFIGAHVRTLGHINGEGHCEIE